MSTLLLLIDSGVVYQGFNNLIIKRTPGNNQHVLMRFFLESPRHAQYAFGTAQP